MQRFDCLFGSSNHIKTAHSFVPGSFNATSTQCSIRGAYEEDELPHRHDTSLNKNTINTPKNLKRFTFLKGAGGSINTGPFEDAKDAKGNSLPKTASTINNRTQTNLEVDVNRKLISKQLLSQVHFCRFVFKLLQRIQTKIGGAASEQLKASMCGVIFSKL